MANPFPIHVLGPSENVNRCRYPDISCHLPSSLPSSPPSSHLCGLNTLLSSPQNADDRLMHTMGIVTTVPFGMLTLLIEEPDEVRRGFESGRTSSSAACHPPSLSLSIARSARNTYHFRRLKQCRVHSQHFVNHRIQVRKECRVGNLLHRWVRRWDAL
jgi:hypothetical protein